MQLRAVGLIRRSTGRGDAEMITEHMKLNSRTDADQWAGEFGLATDGDEAILASWIWENKPTVGCSINDHPIMRLSDDEFWALFQEEGKNDN